MVGVLVKNGGRNNSYEPNCQISENFPAFSQVDYFHYDIWHVLSGCCRALFGLLSGTFRVVVGQLSGTFHSPIAFFIGLLSGYYRAIIGQLLGCFRALFTGFFECDTDCLNVREL
ncbi:hypothetical protein [Sedimenticola hydrogenitrophicus]|uniref:hypothetical protein n=1 Tax=Sedimenticola hydrogenitrophicus TaxID=2967975 RepID=UPI0023AF141C|nr:hypothetical protein [Sedimenticola hydrogenitrophicus]